MRALIVMLLGLFGSWSLIDVHSKSVLHNAIAPLIFILLLIAFVFWLVLKFGSNRGNGDSGADWSDGGSGFADGFFDSGSDSGGGGDGGGGD